jgi:hypothetical protein
MEDKQLINDLCSAVLRLSECVKLLNAKICVLDTEIKVIQLRLQSVGTKIIELDNAIIMPIPNEEEIN